MDYFNKHLVIETINRLRTENAQLHKQIKEMDKHIEHADKHLDDRLMEWYRSSHRKPASIAFTAGGLRNAARVVEGLENHITQLRKENGELKGYAEHKVGCLWGASRTCLCGLSNLLKGEG